ncbi:MAG TPA: aryl-sulfate sulfotransferase [Syntrophales bacterium]|nr:aryl-sulfate sulfotransferase [Syntrophales bacterium]
MKRSILIVMALALVVAMPLGSVYALETFKGPTEINQYNPDKAYNGYTMFTPNMSPTSPYKTYLIDMWGNVVHTWSSQYGVGLYARLLPNGSLLRGATVPAANAADTYGVLSGPRCGGFEEYDWDGNVTWQYFHYSEDSISHHDFRRIWNKQLGAYTTIFLTFERMTPQNAIDWGCDPKYVDDYTNNGNGWSCDGIYEVDMNGNIVWKWTFADHLCQDYDPTKPNFGVISEMPEKLNINWETPYGGPRTDWTHCNSLDYHEDLGHICVNAKHTSEFYVIDHDGTFVAGNPAASIAAAASDAGDFLYRFGNPSVYDQGEPAAFHTEGNQQMYASHDIQWIGGTNAPWDASELPGGGNFLIFDNGTWCTLFAHSEILEINPFVLDATGTKSASYVNPPDAGYTWQAAIGGVGADGCNLSNQVQWRFQSQVPTSFFGSFVSSCQRLPNGNTLIDSGPTGHFFEVTANKEVVWEYQNPVGITGIATSLTDAAGGMFFYTFRCHRYGPDYSGLAGRKLESQGTITGRIPTLSGGGDVWPETITYTGWGAAALSGEGGGGDAGGGGGGGGGGY